jgi:hypothetical protein
VLKLTVSMSDAFDEDKQEFIVDEFVLELEHSLVSMSKWESEFKKPFLAPGEKTNVEVIRYIECMFLSPEVPSNIIDRLTKEHYDAIQKYIGDNQTATWFNETEKKPSATSQKITNELVYYWMVSYQIPWEAQYWHLSRLFTLIKVFNAQNEKPKPKTTQEAAAERQRLNAERRAKYGTSG